MSDDDLRRAYDTAWPFPNAHLAGLRAVERAARAAAFDDVVAGIRAVQAAYDEQEGRPNVPGSVCSDCIGVVNALRARAEGQSNG